MAAFTLTTLRARVREKADMPVAGFIADTSTSLDAYINEGIELLHDKLIEAYGADYVEKSTTYTYNSGDISLPQDFYKLLGVDLNASGAVITLEPYNRRERNTFKNAGTFGFYGTIPRYKLSSVGGVAGTGALRLLPPPASGATGTIWYSPVATTLVNASDTVNFPAGWEKYVVIYAAMQCLAKEESDTSFLQGQLAMLDEKFKSIVENRDVGAPQHSVDVDNINSYNFLWRY